MDPLPPADRTRSTDDDLDGRTFAASAVSGPGDVDDRTRFRYRQDGEVVWADYAGGTVVRGHLVGLRRGARLDFRYVHLDTAGETATGRCETAVERVGDRLRLHEEWHWESRPGSGTTVLDPGVTAPRSHNAVHGCREPRSGSEVLPGASPGGDGGLS